MTATSSTRIPRRPEALAGLGEPEDLADTSAEPMRFRRPGFQDGAALWRLVRDGGGLDLNSPYAYLMMGQWFAETCVIAERQGCLAGFVLGFVPPQQPDTVFVWQIGVDAALRGGGLGQRLLDRLVDHAPAAVRFLEATVTPSNRASERLFTAFARGRGARLAASDLFPAEAFPINGHEAERLFRIGPLTRHENEEQIDGSL